MNANGIETEIDERRQHQRVEFNLKKSMMIQQTKEASIFDVSEGGASFLSDSKYKIGSEVIVGTGVMWIHANVLECLEWPNDDTGVTHYKVRCQFATIDEDLALLSRGRRKLARIRPRRRRLSFGLVDWGSSPWCLAVC